MAKTIGSALLARREELGLDKGRAASRIGMSRTTYGSYERDAQRPSIEVFPALIEFLDVSLEDFLTLYGATCVAIARASFAEAATAGFEGPANPEGRDETEADDDEEEVSAPTDDVESEAPGTSDEGEERRSSSPDRDLERTEPSSDEESAPLDPRYFQTASIIAPATPETSFSEAAPVVAPVAPETRTSEAAPVVAPIAPETLTKLARSSPLSVGAENEFKRAKKKKRKKRR